MAADMPQTPSTSRLKELIAQWTTASKLLLGGLLVGAVLLLIIVLKTFISDKEHGVLYANLAPEDYVALSNWLGFRDIEYSGDPEQKSIFVATDHVDTTRLEMAKDKLPSTNEDSEYPFSGRTQALIDSLLGSDPLIAVQRELSKTISALDQVRSARVHLNLPAEDRFTGSRPRATVLLTMMPGRVLSADQLHGVMHLVSVSVSGLQSGDVQVFDSSGRLLSTDIALQGVNYFHDPALSYQASLERSLERKAQDLVDAMIGSGHTLVKVAAELDFARNETTSERYNPDEAVVRSEHIERLPVGESGAAAGSESFDNQGSTPRYRSSLTTSSKVDYEISKTTTRTVRPVGEVKQLSVTILVADEKQITAGGVASFQPRSADDMEEIRALVSGALSLRPERGDVIHLKRMPMQAVEAEQGPAPRFSLLYLLELIPVGNIILLLLIFLLFYLLLLKPILQLLRSAMERQVSEDTAPDDHTLSETERGVGDEDLSTTLKNEVQSNPLAAAHIIKQWIQEA